MAYRSPRKRGRFVPAAALGTAAWFVLESQGPLVEGNTINAIGAAAACLLLICGAALLSDIFYGIGDLFDRAFANKPTGLKGTAGWIKSLKEIKADLIHKDWGPYWGSFKSREIIADFICAFVVGPTGSGKSTKMIETNALALKDFDKVIIDFKSVLTPTLAKALEKHGPVRKLNLGGLFTELVGDGDKYNPLWLVADCYWNGGLESLVDLITELCLWLYPEPTGENSKDDNKYFREGTRRKISFAIQACVLVKGYEATLGDVLQMLNDQESLTRHSLWAAGKLEQENGDLAEMPIKDSPWVKSQSAEDVDNYIEFFKAFAGGIAKLVDDETSKTAESFIEGAREGLAPFNITGRANKQTSTSNFRFSELKESTRPTTVFLMLDPENIEAQAKVVSIIQWAMLRELRQHPNKRRKVYILADEISNIPWPKLGSALSWMRDYSIAPLLVLQSFPAFAHAHGRHTLEVLLSECDIKQFLPGQRNQQTLDMTEKMLAHQSIVARNHNSSRKEGHGIDSEGFSETGRPLMTADEIRRTSRTITFIRGNKPLLHDSPSIAEIAPWRKMPGLGVNPFYGKPFLLPIKLRIKRSTPFSQRFKRWFSKAHS